MTLLHRIFPRECADCGTDYTCPKCDDEGERLAW